MLDERTRRAGERAAQARRRAFSNDDVGRSRARPLGVVPVLLLCLVGAVVDGYAVVAFTGAGAGFASVNVGLAASALVAAFALTTEISWAWTVTWMYLALHVFVDFLTVDVVGPVGFGIAAVYALALTYATARRIGEVAGGTPTAPAGSSVGQSSSR
ncbi:hypothetical protein [Halorubellus salinus]|uniref:hypothetical protein n=1 Tax=Halorubellus salinus TaxID=755309 RepID=UPI001D0888EB|nr:hypothetical protein [Halorubellus salinus]